MPCRESFKKKNVFAFNYRINWIQLKQICFLLRKNNSMLKSNI